jgi:vacuolar-type H+-ATPase subunit F/Vma7
MERTKAKRLGICFLHQQIIKRLERRDRMEKNEELPYFVEEPALSTGNTKAELEEQTKNSELVSKPKIGETIIGDDGITGQIR